MKLVTRRLLLLFLVPNIIFVALAFATRNIHLIGAFNIINLAVAVMVVIAYAPVVIDIFTNERPIDRSDWLGLGVFLSWQSTIMLRLYSIAWRWMGQPDWLTDSDILSYGLFVQFSAGILHLAAPGALNARVPTRRWINIGIWVGVFVLVALVLGYFFDALAIDGVNLRER